MKLSDVITIRKSSLQRKNKRAWVFAQLAGFEGSGYTEDEAIHDVIGQIGRANRYGQHRDYFFADDGTMFCLYFAFDSWCYDIVRPSMGVQGLGVPSSCHLSITTRTEAVDRVKARIAQYNESHGNSRFVHD